jgi:hypothetical protein
VLLLHFFKNYQHGFGEIAGDAFCVDGSSLIFFVFFAQISLLFYFLDTKIVKNQSQVDIGL